MMISHSSSTEHFCQYCGLFVIAHGLSSSIPTAEIIQFHMLFHLFHDPHASLLRLYAK